MYKITIKGMDEKLNNKNNVVEKIKIKILNMLSVSKVKYLTLNFKENNFIVLIWSIENIIAVRHKNVMLS